MNRITQYHVFEVWRHLLLVALTAAVGFGVWVRVYTKAKSLPPPANSFSWSMRERFGAKAENGLVDYHWDPVSQTYDDAYVHPTGWVVDFNACGNTPAPSTFSWEIDGKPITETKCSFAYEFPTLTTYVIKLTATTPDGQTSTTVSNITLRDLFIVSIGDSFASGEGNPDVPRHKLKPARWIFRPCHRSASAAPAQAAIEIERSDPHSSVTFISFACSGAVVENLLTIKQEAHGSTMAPQLNKVFRAAGIRPIDALLVSIGGNDISFATLVTKAIALRHAESDPGADRLLREGMAALPGRFAALAQRLNAPGNSAKVASVFITQYPDIVRDETRDFCDHSTPITELLNGISAAESEWALNAVIVPLNSLIQDQAKTWGWNYVDGILNEFGGDSLDHVAHGFCADDQRWVNTFNDSWRIQGNKYGTVHPNLRGHAWYKQRLLEELRKKGVTPAAII